MDSVLGGYDIPKIYLRDTKRFSDVFDYEVADGQQRLTAIWRFINDEFALSSKGATRDGYAGRTFSELSDMDKERILSFKIVVGIVYDDTEDEVRELFFRLQKGDKLTPPEIRNGMQSAIGTVIRAMALTHRFFNNSRITEARFLRDDYLAHAFSLQFYGQTRDAKAATLAAMYKEYAISLDLSVTQRVSDILTYMAEMNRLAPGLFRTKWGFYDVYWFISSNWNSRPAPNVMADRFRVFEDTRKVNTSNPEAIIESNRAMYDYIKAFRTEGSTIKNLKIRAVSLATELSRIAPD